MSSTRNEPDFHDFGIGQPLTSQMASCNNEAMDVIRRFVDENRLTQHQRQALRAMLRDSLDEVMYGCGTACDPAFLARVVRGGICGSCHRQPGEEHSPACGSFAT